MFLGMDSTSKILTANYPYPNLKCTITLECNANGLTSQNIIATSSDYRNTWPYLTSNNILISSLPLS